MVEVLSRRIRWKILIERRWREDAAGRGLSCSNGVEARFSSSRDHYLQTLGVYWNIPHNGAWAIREIAAFLVAPRDGNN
jgi:hypothetical protein